ncbi:TK protein kinase [Loa loa]|uniref:TK protein kinase n=1 Tax=Loa loa TaxID=7209 RepID=A0A1I7VWD1_LOALO|nr:TK protein kinase [Loa loa]EFO21399.1 TK protein kinase [Loa loa]
MNASLAIRYPVEYHASPVPGPKPTEISEPSIIYQESKHINGLIMVPDKKVIHYKINIISEIGTKHRAFAGKTYRAVLSSEGRYSEVAFKRLKKSCFQEELFEKCLNLLHIERRQYATELLSIAKSTSYSVQGEEYICKIAGFSTDDKIYGPWVAYEFVSGNPLDVALVMRRRDGLPPLTHRANFEIMYQIAAGMRYLEDNSLCHRDLRAANILVYVQHQYSMAIKITDYMLTLSILSKLPENSDLSSLHWRWMDCEALEYGQFGIKTDIWSFGCVMFEILNPGKLPYSLEKIPIEDPQGYISK